MRLIFLEVKKAEEYLFGKYFSFSFSGIDGNMSHLELENCTQTSTYILEVLYRKKNEGFISESISLRTPILSKDRSFIILI